LKHKILIVEDEKNLGATLSDYLKGEGHEVSWAQSISEANQLFEDHLPEIVLMDIGLPDGNGIDLARELKQREHDFVLLFLSALNDPDLKLEGLELGGVDYITKPFNLKELRLRLERILPQIDRASFNLTTINFEELKIYIDEEETPLSVKEAALLKCLFKNKSKPVNRDILLNHIWGKESLPGPRTLDNLIVKVRKILENDPAWVISNIRGHGYRLELKDEK
jgi:two-component system, OmpR family, alkaline phosphatase synthesis response regulator PhoP